MGLSSGTRHRLCVWWLEVPTGRSVRHRSSSAEVHWFTTPDRPTALIEYFSVQNTSGRRCRGRRVPHHRRLSWRWNRCGARRPVSTTTKHNRHTPGCPAGAMRLRRTLSSRSSRGAPVTEAYTKEFSIPLTASWIPFVGYCAPSSSMSIWQTATATPGSLDVSFLVTYRWASGGRGIRGPTGDLVSPARSNPDPEIRGAR